MFGESIFAPIQTTVSKHQGNFEFPLSDAVLRDEGSLSGDNEERSTAERNLGTVQGFSEPIN